MRDLAIGGVEQFGTREQCKSNPETCAPDSSKSRFLLAFRTRLPGDVDEKPWSLEVGISGCIYEGEMEIAALTRSFRADERGD